MSEIGKMNTLPVMRISDFGVYLDAGGDLGEILLPNRYVSEDMEPGSMVDVFIMLDSEDRYVATTDTPLGMVGEFVALKVVAVTDFGAFMDWGMLKDLLVPFREQKTTMCVGDTHVVYIYVDAASKRLVASTKIEKYMDMTSVRYDKGAKVDLLIYAKTDLGYKALINGAHEGLLFDHEVHEPLMRGQHIEGFISQVRGDGKISLCLQKPGLEKVVALTDRILTYLNENSGFMPITDKNSPEKIYSLFGVSKKTYKKAIGALYKKRLITFEKNGTKLT
ncbi:MAG: S1-like domain-containing RNA-binding protein [Kiritimatiellae bacterium]|jgi:predicted RNA-binding protein (virulence factor B family)|nr:S1-like domain-containing RNA-binding protein [Kiritimatiellia bacterium]